MINKELLHKAFMYLDGKLIRRSNKKISGYNNGFGYLQVRAGGPKEMVHRIIYLMHHGYLPEFIDHIDGNTLNNKVENLRACTRSQNNRNSRIRKDNKSGVKCVSWHKQCKKWVVRIFVGGKRRDFGRFKGLELAELVANEAREKYHGLFANSGNRFKV